MGMGMSMGVGGMGGLRGLSPTYEDSEDEESDSDDEDLFEYDSPSFAPFVNVGQVPVKFGISA